MKLLEKTVKELHSLEPTQMSAVYEMVKQLKEPHKIKNGVKTSSAHLRIREILRQCKGRLSEDITSSRQDRI